MKACNRLIKILIVKIHNSKWFKILKINFKSVHILSFPFIMSFPSPMSFPRKRESSSFILSIIENPSILSIIEKPSILTFPFIMSFPWKRESSVSINSIDSYFYKNKGVYCHSRGSGNPVPLFCQSLRTPLFCQSLRNPPLCHSRENGNPVFPLIV